MCSSRCHAGGGLEARTVPAECNAGGGVGIVLCRGTGMDVWGQDRRYTSSVMYHELTI